MRQFKKGLIKKVVFVALALTLLGSTPVLANGKKTFMGSVNFRSNSDQLIGMVTTMNPGMEKIINYQIPSLSGEPPFIFSAIYAAIAEEEGDNGDDRERHSLDRDKTRAIFNRDLDSFLFLTNTSGNNISIDADFYDTGGNLLTSAHFDLGPHQTLVKSVLDILTER